MGIHVMVGDDPPYTYFEKVFDLINPLVSIRKPSSQIILLLIFQVLLSH